ncbi:MAG: S-adenosylmethionine:tRNA ribosyltransferase-isomerase [Bacteroidales bacterium]|nr:S-adenosylmethionine:tRNA ribosyltransferase-isomerase [Bacteroidales bacterium]
MMNDPRHIQIKDYNYPLPDERIAKYPLTQRDQSKLLLRASDGTVSESVFCHLPEYLPAGALMVFNNTKVIQARLHFHKTTGALIEIFCLEPHTPLDYQQSFATTGSVTWTCLVGNLKKWKEGALEREIALKDRSITLSAERIGVSGTGFEIRFSWNDDSVSWAEVLDAIGELPIPPYLNRETEESDLKTYQTVYSKIKGSVAAPTAGLHFTPEVLNALDAKGIERAELTLHVGAGTFKPVKSEEIEGHTMHSEWIAVRREIIERLIAHGGRCIAVGTTSVRTLESLYYIGIIISRLVAEGRALTDIHAEDLHVPQWMPYETKEAPSAVESLEWIVRYLDANHYTTLSTATQIIIAPGYTYHIVRTIVTNFHQPQSTLLLLVSAFVGGEWRPIYDYALAHDFRFLSYGDSSVLNYDALEK